MPRLATGGAAADEQRIPRLATGGAAADEQSLPRLAASGALADEQSLPQPATGGAAAAPASVPAGGAPGRLFNRNFLLLWQGQTVSQLGNQAFALAMAYWTLEATGSASLMGLLLATMSLPVPLLSPIGGVLADRFSRIRILVACDVVAGLAMIIQSGAMLSGRCSRPVLVAMLFAVALISGVVNGFFLPTLSACIPDLVPKERVGAANSLNQFSVQAATLLGQSIGGVFYRLLGGPRLFLFDGLTFLFCAGSESLVRLPPRPAPEDLALGAGARRFAASLREGLAYVRRTPGLLNFIVCPAVYNFFSMALLVLMPFYVRINLHAGSEWYGFLIAVISLGSIVGFVIAGLVRLTGTARMRYLVTMIAIAPAPMAIAGFVHRPIVGLAVGFAMGVMLGVINVNLLTLLQTKTPAELRGRVLGLWTSLVQGVMPIGMLMGGFAGDLTGKNIPLVFTTCGVLTLAVTALALSRRSTRQYLGTD
ncbi:MAG TPA: MFS transporter [Thermoanaerobaculia bacterium]|nr:MFS transporter [Thermoanaerobaculia bacterium]